MKDLTGMRFGFLTVIRKTEQKKFGVFLWECSCDCGKIAMLPANALTSGNTKSCGCYHDTCGIIDLVGQRFGRLTVQKITNMRKNNTVVWECLCDCGKIAYIQGSNLRKGSTKSCGCYRWYKHFIDLTGQKIGRLTVLKMCDSKIHHENAWECRCECGKVVSIRTSSLKAGTTRSCGCLNEVSIQAFKKNSEIANIDGTYIYSLMQKTRANNTSGRIGVYYVKERNKWHARIEFKKKRYNLGAFEKKEDAIRARELAEEKLHGTFLEWYYKEFLPTIRHTD